MVIYPDLHQSEGKLLNQDELDELLCSVLLNTAKTRAFIKRLKAAKPDQWLRVNGNVAGATFMFAPRKVKETVYLIGVFDPNDDVCWPWYNDHLNGAFLSGKNRICKIGKAAEFATPDEARHFFHLWSGKRHLKMELVELERTKTVEGFN